MIDQLRKCVEVAPFRRNTGKGGICFCRFRNRSYASSAAKRAMCRSPLRDDDVRIVRNVLRTVFEDHERYLRGDLLPLGKEEGGVRVRLESTPNAWLEFWHSVLHAVQGRGGGGTHRPTRVPMVCRIWSICCESSIRRCSVRRLRGHRRVCGIECDALVGLRRRVGARNRAKHARMGAHSGLLSDRALHTLLPGA